MSTEHNKFIDGRGLTLRQWQSRKGHMTKIIATRRMQS
jgi:hypothetical protein